MDQFRYESVMQDLDQVEKLVEPLAKLMDRDADSQRGTAEFKQKWDAAQSNANMGVYTFYNRLSTLRMTLETAYHALAANPVLDVSTSIQADLIRLLDADGKEIGRAEKSWNLEVTLDGMPDQMNPRKFVVVAQAEGCFTTRGWLEAAHKYNTLHLQLVTEDPIYE